MDPVSGISSWFHLFSFSQQHCSSSTMSVCVSHVFLFSLHPSCEEEHTAPSKRNMTHDNIISDSPTRTGFHVLYVKRNLSLSFFAEVIFPTATGYISLYFVDFELCLLGSMLNSSSRSFSEPTAKNSNSVNIKIMQIGNDHVRSKVLHATYRGPYSFL